MVVVDVLRTLMAGLHYQTKGPRLIHVPFPPYPGLNVAQILPWESIYPAEKISPWSAADESYNVRPLRNFSTEEMLQSCGFPVVASIEFTATTKHLAAFGARVCRCGINAIGRKL